MNKPLLALVAAAALQGCAMQAPPPAGPTRNYDEGIAKSCTATPIDLSASTTASSTITMTNDGWCAVRTVEKDGKPYALGLVQTRPGHGFVLIRSYGNQTRLEYTADPRYVGADSFTVALRSRTANAPDATVQVTVNVTAGAVVAPPPAATPAPTPARPAARPATRPAARPATR